MIDVSALLQRRVLNIWPFASFCNPIVFAYAEFIPTADFDNYFCSVPFRIRIFFPLQLKLREILVRILLTFNKLKSKIPINWILQWKDRGAVVISNSGAKVRAGICRNERGCCRRWRFLPGFRLVMQIRSARLSRWAESYVLIADMPLI